MDYDKFYKLDPEGNYNLHFLNRDKLTVPEIKKIFSTYGNVLSVNVTKDEGGLRFVKYKTLQETITCLEGLRESGKIHLLPEKSKINKKMNKTDESQQQAMENSFQKATFNRQLNSDTIYDDSMYGHKSLNMTEDSDFWNTATDYDKFYRLSKDGLSFTVHFINKKGFTLEKIRELFSPYGKVLSVHGSATNNGLKFVKYETKEEIIRCIKGFQNSTLISILPQKDKIAEAKTIDQNNLSSWQAAKTEDTSQRIFGSGKLFNSSSAHNGNNGQERFSEYREKSIHDTKTSDWTKFEDNNFLDTSFYNSRQTYKSNENESKHRGTIPQMFNDKYSSSRRENSINNEDYDQAMTRKQQETKFCPSLKTETSTKIDRNMRISTHDYKIPTLISNTEMKSKEFDRISDSPSNETKNSSKIVCIPMQEIIVANIHMKYGVHYILHLFEKYSPISATLVKTITETNIRYCHVYFKTIEDAVAVEEEFDNFDLFGKSLIVLRKSRLIDETACN